ncbi:hypothetical protein BGZ60DRAFT_532226 [Tricladium varicosporioides]|nr:hypothetical protein BGZ60DRAFT_532226 [Hymenoscyphus varicosporioides]
MDPPLKNENSIFLTQCKTSSIIASREVHLSDDSSSDTPPGKNIAHSQVERSKANTQDVSRKGQLPLAGIASLVFVVLLTATATAILAASDGSPLSDWQVLGSQVQPQVWLSVLTTLMDVMLVFGLAEGTMLKFWRHSSRGTSLGELHEIYESGFVLTSLKRLFTGSFNIVVFACLVNAISTLRGPLFQRASTVQGGAIRHTSGIGDMLIAQSFPMGFFEETAVRGFKPEFQDVLEGFTMRRPLNSSHLPCRGICEGKVKSFGIFPTCTTSSFDFLLEEGAINYVENGTSNISTPYMWEYTTSENKFSIPVFGVNMSLTQRNDTNFLTTDVKLMQPVTVATTFKQAPACHGVISNTVCNISFSPMNFDVVFNNGTLTLKYPHWQNDTRLDFDDTWDNILTSSVSGTISVLIDLVNSLYTQSYNLTYSTSDHLWPDPTYFFSRDVNPMTTLPFVKNHIQSNRAQFESSGADAANCNVTWNDPMQDVLDSLREIMFRSAVEMPKSNLTDFWAAMSELQTWWMVPTDSDLSPHGNYSTAGNWTQTVHYVGTETRVVYRTNWTFAAFATVVSLLGVVACAPLYWGWWELPRDGAKSFNPIIVADAFDAPLMRGASGVRGDFVKEVSGEGVVYGVVGRGEVDVGARLRFLRYGGG